MSLSPALTQKLLRGEPLSIVAWDLECTSLSAMMGRILCCAFKPLGKEPYVFRADRSPYRSADIVDDSKLAKGIRDELEKFDVIVAHNGKLFDSKFLDARLFKAGLLPRAKQFFVDPMWIVRANLRISSKLLNVQTYAGLDVEKTDISWDQWQRAGAFNKAGMAEVVDHCVKDVEVLEAAYLKLVPFVKEMRTG